MRVKGGCISTFVLGLGLACGGASGGRGGGEGEPGGKADDAAEGFDPELSRHRNAVNACLAAADRAAPEPTADDELRACLEEANNEVWAIVQANLPEKILNRRARAEVPPRDDEVVQIIGILRDAQDEVCHVLVDALVDTTERDKDRGDGSPGLARCLAVAELNTANLVDGHVDLKRPLVEVPPPWMRYSVCEAYYQELAEDDAVKALYELRDCAKRHDAEFRVSWARTILGQDEEDRSLRQVVTAVSDAFELESRVGFDLCNLLSYSAPRGVEEDISRAQCTASASIQVGRLVEALTVVEDEDEDDEDEDEDEDDDKPDDRPDDEPDPPAPTPDEGEVCYPGPDQDWSVCVPLVFPSPFPEGYHYASGALGGDANYRKPIALIDLDAVDASVKITRDFTLDEIAHRYKGRYAIVQPHAVASLQQLRDDVGAITVNSGFRSPAYNEGVSGATYSRHMYGDGFDLDPNEVALDDLEQACQFRGGFLVEYTSHVHCDFRLSSVDETFFGAK